MVLLYNLSIFTISFLFKIAALFNKKARAFVDGRKNIFDALDLKFRNNTSPVVWMHCASLGEFEQGRPIIEAFKNQWPDYKFILTFFSPSGYEIRKDYLLAEHVCYMPWDTKGNAQQFISITRPILSIFIKYEFWYHYTSELKKQNISILSVSSIFRQDQLFFKSYGSFYRKILQNFSYFFVQNDTSVKLLHGIGIKNCERAGDTRFDRVVALSQQTPALSAIENFKDNQHTWVVGSCWGEDFDVLAPFINKNGNKLKFIIAPHEINESFLTTIENALQVKTIRLSKLNGINAADYDVLLIDNIGMLSTLYRYGEFAYVGGAFGKGLHNILEPACYGIPVFFGDQRYEKFKEAVDLIKRGGAYEIANYTDLRAKYELLISRPENYLMACEVTALYVQENLGATAIIMAYCQQLLKPHHVN